MTSISPTRLLSGAAATLAPRATQGHLRRIAASAAHNLPHPQRRHRLDGDSGHAGAGADLHWVGGRGYAPTAFLQSCPAIGQRLGRARGT
ncbi:MAG: hypothetical protein QOJ37_139 [Pseudonocardiales bacterium]|nr:hypothetical protein [Pseudonocardiales bacterium]